MVGGAVRGDPGVGLAAHAAGEWRATEADLAGALVVGEVGEADGGGRNAGATGEIDR